MATVGTLDATRRVPARLAALGASNNFAARCLSMSSGELSNLLNSKKRLGGAKSKQMTDLLDDLEMLAKAFHPAPISWKDHELILELVRQLKEGELLVGTIRQGVLHLSGNDLQFGKF